MAPVDVKYTQIFINNEFVNSVSGKTFATLNPATGKKTCDVQEGDKADADKAVRAAQDAFKLGSPWRRMDATGRARLLNKLADLIERDQEYLTNLEVMDNGMPVKTATVSVMASVSYLRYGAGYADKLHGKVVPLDGDYFCYSRYEPIGVVAAIIPWNFPCGLTGMKLSCALTVGNTLVIKPAEQSPLTALYIASLVKEAGFPPGVINVVPGYGPTAGAALTGSMDVDMVTFTGSTEVGRIIQRAGANSNLKKIHLELGGKSPNVVFADCDLDYAVETSHWGVFLHSGQVCCAGTRIFVQEDIYDEFVRKSKERAERRVVGDPYDVKTEGGPQIDQDQLDKVLELIESGKKEGAKLQCGGQRKGDCGYFVESTVFSDVTDDMRIAKEEIFGPVQQILKFKTIEEVVERANATTYGLAGAVFTRDIDKALTVANTIRAGLIWINNYGLISPMIPFGGYKMSGVGRDGGEDGFKDYCEVKTVVIKVPQKNS
ncbi:retinal dehydrogenase 1-like [Patiria miniata]|uniref:Aldehyde dehydrogenase domain-containing protein n=1 Tax=Patiria miniata TaxID=46514 RepID=A0A914AR78_PATMI|nr:retinal dehydrogenase 1-like [Patiria miniata]